MRYEGLLGYRWLWVVEGNRCTLNTDGQMLLYRGDEQTGSWEKEREKEIEKTLMKLSFTLFYLQCDLLSCNLWYWVQRINMETCTTVQKFGAGKICCFFLFCSLSVHLFSQNYSKTAIAKYCCECNLKYCKVKLILKVIKCCLFLECFFDVTNNYWSF